MKIVKENTYKELPSSKLSLVCKSEEVALEIYQALILDTATNENEKGLVLDIVDLDVNKEEEKIIQTFMFEEKDLIYLDSFLNTILKERRRL